MINQKFLFDSTNPLCLVSDYSKFATLQQENAIHKFKGLYRLAMVREKVLENEKFSRSGKSQGITFSVREI